MVSVLKKTEISKDFLGKTEDAIRLIFWIEIPEKGKDQIFVRFLEKRGDGKILKVLGDRREMDSDCFRSLTDRYLVEWLYDECQIESLDHCAIVPRHKIPNFLALLSKGRSFLYGKSKEKLTMLPDPARPILRVVKEAGGNVQLSVKYRAGDELKDLEKNGVLVENPLWVRNDDHIFEIEQHEIFRKWPMLKKGKFMLGSHQAHDFLFNQIPRLKQEIEVDIDKGVSIRESSRAIRPQFMVDIAVETKRITLTPKVSYNNQVVPLLKEIKDEFLFFQRDESGNGEYIKRDIETESRARSLITQAHPALKEKHPYCLQLIFGKSAESCFPLMLDIMDDMPSQWQWSGIEHLTDKKIITRSWGMTFEVRMSESDEVVVMPTFKCGDELLSMYDLFKSKNKLKKVIQLNDSHTLAILSSDICDFFEYYIERGAIDKSREFMTLHAGDTADLERRI